MGTASTASRAGDDLVPPDASCDRPPLVALLNSVKNAFVADFDRRLVGSAFCDLSLAHSRNVLRHLGDGPRRPAELVELAGVTKQAISQQLVHLERNGLVTVEPDPNDQRARVVTLTRDGAKAQALVLRTFTEIEDDWSTLLDDPDDMAVLRRAMSAILARVGIEPNCAADGPPAG